MVFCVAGIVRFVRQMYFQAIHSESSEVIFPAGQVKSKSRMNYKLGRPFKWFNRHWIGIIVHNVVELHERNNRVPIDMFLYFDSRYFVPLKFFILVYPIDVPHPFCFFSLDWYTFRPTGLNISALLSIQKSSRRGRLAPRQLLPSAVRARSSSDSRHAKKLPSVQGTNLTTRCMFVLIISRSQFTSISGNINLHEDSDGIACLYSFLLSR